MTPENVTSSLIAASAGTGKTYQLSTRFIALLALGVEPGSMIALTFTRKAAGEFRDRILRDLAGGASSEEGAVALAQRIRENWRGRSGPEALPPLCPRADEAKHPLTQEAFRGMLRSVVHQLSHLRLSTLDSFFHLLVSMSKPELGLSDITLLSESDGKLARRQAFHALFNRISGNDRETEAFLNLFRDIAQENGRDMMEIIDALLTNYQALFHAAPEASLWGRTEGFGLPAAPLSPLLDEEERSAMEQNIRRLATALPLGKALQKGYLAFPGKMAQPTLEGTKRVLKELDSPPPPDATPEERELQELCRRLRQDTAARILNEMWAQTASSYHLLHVYRGYYEALIRSRGLLTFDDITRLAPGVLERDGAPTRLAYRLDSTLQHWMLDEFQDTSDAQWQAIRPLVEEIATEAATARDKASPRSLFIVGDSKQSIYGWRGASSDIFTDLTRLSPWEEALQQGEMARSWRSSPVLMDFVNDVFPDFPRHSAARREEEYPGLVQISAYPKVKKGDGEEDDGEAGLDAGMEAAVARVLDGLPLAEKSLSVGILVRSNEQAKEIHAYLRRHRPELRAHIINEVPAGLSSPLGETLFSFFIWLQHPADTYRRSLLRTSPLWPVIARSAHPWIYWRARLEQEGYAAVVQALRAALLRQPGLLTDYHLRHLDTWLSAALAFDAQGGSLSEWNRFMQNLTRQENPPKDQIHILTIHKSKGLEYDAVILPLSAGLIDNTKHLGQLIARDEQGRPTGILQYSSADKIAFWPALTPFVDAWKKAQLQEGENLLYVALTRAARANYILLPGDAKATPRSFAGRILHTLGIPEGEMVTPDTLPLTRGEPQWYDSLPPRRPLSDAPPAPVLLPATRRRRRQSPSQENEAPASPRTPSAPPEAPRSSRADALRFGSAVHALLEELEWWNPDAPPTWYVHPRRPEEYLAAEALKNPAFRSLFIPAPGDEALNEQALEALEGSCWVSAVMDRIILHADGSAHIIDYKTGRPSADIKQKYLPQMSQYRRLLSRALNCPPRQISVTLAFLSPGAVSLHPYAPRELDANEAALPSLPL